MQNTHSHPVINNPKPGKVVIIDGHQAHRTQLTEALQSFFPVIAYTDCSQALAGLQDITPSVILADAAAPALDDFLIERRRGSLAHIPLIGTFTNGSTPIADGDASLAKPFRRSSLIRLVSEMVNRQVERQWKALPDRPRKVLEETVGIFNSIGELAANGEMLDFSSVNAACSPLVDAVSNRDYRSILDNVRGHDNYSYVHSLRVGTMLIMLGCGLGLGQTELLQVATGGLLHDIGKMVIPHEVLNKPGRLNDDEWTVMRSHVDKTIYFLNTHTQAPSGVITIAAQHHEKLGGGGYPYGLKGAELNELARMATIVDIFSALTDRRVYKPSMPAEKALAIMSEDMKGDLDQHLLLLFREILLDSERSIQ